MLAAMRGAEQVVVQPGVRAYMLSLGDAGRRWLETLPDLVTCLHAEWDLVLGPSLPGGVSSFVCRVTTSGAEPAVLKIALPGPGFDAEAAVLVAARGEGYAHLLQVDLLRGAMLLEGADQPLDRTSTDVPAALDLLARTLLRAWRVPVSVAPPVDRTTHKAATLAALIERLAGGDAVREAGLRPATAVVDRALACAGELLDRRDETRQVVVHGDPHPENLLRLRQGRPGAEAGYVFVDPDGFRCEPEYDLGTAVREWNHHLLGLADPVATVRSWCTQLATLTGCDEELIWRWGFTERVSTGLYLIHHGMPRQGAPFLQVATRMLRD